MTSSTGGTPGGGNSLFDRVGEPVDDRPPARPPVADAPPSRRRVPLWLLVLAGLLVVGGVVAAVLLLGNAPEPPEQPAAATVTVTEPAPTPTVPPLEREGGSAFSQALPATVVDLSLTEQVEDEAQLLAGALEGYRLTYSDGAEQVTLLAGQWRDAAAADAALEQVRAQLLAGAEQAGATDEGSTDEGATDEAEGEVPAPGAPTAPEEGPVEVDGEQVGRYVLVPRADGSAALAWTNGTALLRLEGSLDAVRQAYAAFPL